MRIKQSLRMKVAVGFSLATILLLLGQTLAIRALAEKQEEKFISEVISDEMTHLIEDYQQNPQRLPPLNQSLQGYVTQYNNQSTPLPDNVRNLSVGIHEIILNDRELHVAIQSYKGSRLYRVYDFSRYEQRLHKFIDLLMLGTAAFILATFWIAIWLSKLLVRQVSDLTQQVSRLRREDSGDLITTQYGDEEVIKLARTFNDYHQRMDALLEREKEFTSNVSHELRTPLTTIKTSYELLIQEPAMSDKSKKRLEGINRATNRMTELVNALLLLARGQSVGSNDTISINECVDEAIESFLGALADQSNTIEISIDEHSSLYGSREALMLVLMNLLKNAITYTSQGRITIRYSGHVLQMMDTGIGIATDEIPHVFERFYRGQTDRRGLGLGLAIVKRVCDQQGWHIAVMSQKNKGTCVSVSFAKQI
jgi:signal transduction histidine kinase